MKTKLYQLHMAYGKHAGADIHTGVVGKSRADGYCTLRYCQACGGFYVLVAGMQQAIAAVDRHWPAKPPYGGPYSLPEWQVMRRRWHAFVKQRPDTRAAMAKRRQICRGS